MPRCVAIFSATVRLGERLPLNTRLMQLLESPLWRDSCACVIFPKAS